MSRWHPPLHQLVPSLVSEDAVGSHTLAVRDLLREAGYRSEIYAEEIRVPGALGVRPWREARLRDRLERPRYIYQGSIASNMADFLATRADRAVVNYHDVTPAPLVERWDPALGLLLRRAVAELATLSRRAHGVIATSATTEGVLLAAGVVHTTVVPPLVDGAAFSAPPDPARLAALAARKRDGGADWLFVGRLTPHKGQDVLVGALAAARRAGRPADRLWLVGRPGPPAYVAALREHVARLGLVGAVELTGPVSAGELAAHYASADVFVCASAHEGFCVPVLEAMSRDLPVVAYAAGAVPDTMGDGGVLVAERRPSALAAAVRVVLADPAARARLVAAGRRRSAALDPAKTRSAFLEALAGLGWHP